jgi:hypothetical protein
MKCELASHTTTHHHINVSSPVSDSPTVSLVAAGRALSLGRTTSYGLAQRGQFPLPVIRAGGKLRVPTAALRRLLALDVVEADRSAAEHLIRDLLADTRLSDQDRTELAWLLIGESL